MGGDDLGSDDELYLGLDDRRRPPPSATQGNQHDDPSSSDDDKDDSPARHGNKRQRQGEPLLSSSSSKELSAKDPAGDSLSADSDERRLFREAVNVDERPIHQQASFITRLCQCHYRSSSSDTSDPVAKATTELIATTPFTFLPAHFVSYNDNTKGVADEETLPYLDKLKRCISAKKLKNWRSNAKFSKPTQPQIASPCVIIVCSSARRAVMILKDLAPLKLPVAKLFPKNGSVSQQLAALKSGGGSVLAVGTPHRLAQLADQSNSQLVHRTQLVVIDTFVSSHGATVVTATDTASHCAAFLMEHVVPQLRSRNDIRIAFL